MRRFLESHLIHSHHAPPRAGEDHRPRMTTTSRNFIPRSSSIARTSPTSSGTPIIECPSSSSNETSSPLRCPSPETNLPINSSPVNLTRFCQHRSVPGSTSTHGSSLASSNGSMSGRRQSPKPGVRASPIYSDWQTRQPQRPIFTFQSYHWKYI
jgi:hypothetical protein